MYTGITQGLFVVTELIKHHNQLIYKVKLNQQLVDGLKLGASISVDGVCQTVVTIDELSAEVEFNAVGETLQITTLGNLKPGQQVSIERSAKFTDEIGGHRMAGHIFETVQIVERQADGDNLYLTIKVSAAAIQYIFEKGFIGVDGSSLTVHHVNWSKRTFVVNLIPYTLSVTNLGKKLVGDQLNLELDASTVVIVDTVKRINGDYVNSSMAVANSSPCGVR